MLFFIPKRRDFFMKSLTIAMITLLMLAGLDLKGAATEYKKSHRRPFTSSRMTSNELTANFAKQVLGAVQQDDLTSSTQKDDMEQLINHWRNIIKKASEKLTKGTFESDKAYQIRVQRVLRRLGLLKDLIQTLNETDVEKARENAYSALTPYLESYDSWKATYEANLERFRDFNIDLKPDNIYEYLGVKGDPSELHLEDVQNLIRSKMIQLKEDNHKSPDIADWFERQMRYIFSNSKAKECYDAWLKGSEDFAKWQENELKALGISDEDLQIIAVEKTGSISEFKAELDLLKTEIENKIIPNIEATTKIKRAL